MTSKSSTSQYAFLLSDFTSNETAYKEVKSLGASAEIRSNVGLLCRAATKARDRETDDRQLCEVGVAGRVVERQAVLYGGAWRIPFAALISRNNRALSLPVRLCVVVLRLWVRLLVCRRFLAHTVKNFSGVAYFVTAPTTRLTTAHLIMKCIQIRIICCFWFDAKCVFSRCGKVRRHLFSLEP